MGFVALIHKPPLMPDHCFFTTWEPRMRASWALSLTIGICKSLCGQTTPCRLVRQVRRLNA